MNTLPHFIIIDDDKLNNKICTVTLEKISKDADIKTFTDPEAGFNYIVSEYSNTYNDKPTVLLLDLAMPGMDGWEFLHRFDELDAAIKQQIKIFILSSSEDKRDMEKAHANANVIEYLIKPLNKHTVELITSWAGKGEI